MIIAFAGRRIDGPEDNTVRFPSENVERVKQQLYSYFIDKGVKYLVASAACGGDLLALDAAQSLNVHTRIVLPYDGETFKAKSVIDRPGDWEKAFDKVLNRKDLNDVINLGLAEDNAEAFWQVNLRILSEAENLANKIPLPVQVLIAWDGEKKPSNDTTMLFIEEATSRHLQIDYIITK